MKLYTIPIYQHVFARWIEQRSDVGDVLSQHLNGALVEVHAIETVYFRGFENLLVNHPVVFSRTFQHSEGQILVRHGTTSLDFEEQITCNKTSGKAKVSRCNGTRERYGFFQHRLITFVVKWND